MLLFRKKTADELEEKLLKVLDQYADNLAMKSTLKEKVESGDKHLKIGVTGGFGLGALGLLGSIATIAISPAIATTAVIGAVTVAGVTMAAGAGILAVGLGYAGISKLYKSFQESKLNKTIYSSEYEMTRKAEEKLLSGLNQTRNSTKGIKENFDQDDIANIMKAVRDGDVSTGRSLVDKIVWKAQINEHNSQQSKMSNDLYMDSNALDKIKQSVLNKDDSTQNKNSYKI